ncbi:HAD family hydrolase [Thiolinea disciformis]|uniref:HAD family hydrolase n=1 Tax=Thiolinea disciformis TaxID=125614 RepID=UPI000362C6AC|nr:HAD family hydrolase [Thiolinea disciformis]
MPDKLIAHNFAQVRDLLQARLERGQLQTVSLDIFDTLLARIDTPEQVQYAVCREVAKSLARPIEQVWQLRQQTEQALRQKALRDWLDPECRFGEWVSAWVEALVGHADLALQRFIITTELELEQLALYIKPDVLAFLHWLAQQGLRVLAISDMYLERAHLLEILRRKGLLSYFEQVHVSSEQCLGKYSGRLFASIRDELNISPSTWVHIGDNPISDRRAACEQGIQGIWLLEKAALRQRETQVLMANMAKRGSTWKGQHFFSVLEQRLRALEPASDDFYYRYGRDVLGAAFSTFMLGLQERLTRKPVDKIFFVARDGYLFQQMYQALPQKLPESYLYLSRKVITAASTADGLTHEQAKVAFYNPKQQGLRSICKIYGVPEDSLRYLAACHGFREMAQPIHDWNDKRLLDFLADANVQALIRPLGIEHRRLLEAYLEQSGFFEHKHIALVDIGWNGTVQKFLKQAFGHRADFPIINAYYFAFVPKLYHDFGAQNYCEGIIHDSRRDNACERIPSEFEEIFEQGARALEATTIAYREQAGVVEPVLKSPTAPDRMAEIACNHMVSSLQQGILAHWRHFQAVQRLTGYQSVEILPYVYGLLERAVVYPTREESRLLSQLVHTEDFGHDHILSIGRDKLSWQDLLKPRQLWHRFKVSAWRYAWLAGFPTNMTNFVLRMAYLRAVKK